MTLQQLLSAATPAQNIFKKKLIPVSDSNVCFAAEYVSLDLCLYYGDFVSEVTSATVYWDAEQKTVVLKEGVLEKQGDAYGYLNNSLSATGWSVLEIRAGYGKTPETDEVTFFLAGYLEGYLTAQ